MNKTKLFLAVAAPAALVMPMDAFAATQVTITGNGIVGTDLSVDVSSLPAGTNITKFEWFHESFDVDGKPNHTSIATTEKYLILATDIGKTILVKVTDDKGVTYESKKVVPHGALPIEGENYVNGKLIAKIKGVPGNQITFTNYQWYLIDGNTVKLLPGATDPELVIPVEATNKSIFLEAKTDKGEIYVSENKSIQKLELKMDELQFEGFGVNGTAMHYVVPGDVLKIKVPEISTSIKVDPNTSKDVTLNANQITYTYQWLYKEGANYSVIQNATTASYTIPANALELQMNQIVVKVTAQVGVETVSTIALNPIMVSNDPITSLTKDIDLLLNKSGKITYNFKIADKSDVAKLEALYQGLTPAAKAQIKNYSILQRALTDIGKVEKITGEINSIVTEIGADDKKKEQYQQRLLALKGEYDQLDYLQRSLDPNNDYDKLLKLLIENPNNMNELSKLQDINNRIVGLLEINSGPAPTYKEKNATDLDKEIKNIEIEINSLSKDYKTAVQNQDILNMAKADVKSAVKFEKMFDKLNGLTPKKQISTAKSIRAAYSKLSLRQQGLVEYKLADLINAEMAEGGAITKLEEKIASLPNKPVDADTWTEYVKVVNTIVSEQKNLTSYTDVANINTFIQMQKDLKVAEKVIAQIKKYESLNPSVTKYSKLLSSYNSALKAMNKLTNVQQEYVYNKGILDKVPENTEDKPNGGDTESSDDSVAGKNFSDEITAALATSTSDFYAYTKEIESLAGRYKNELPSGARKYVTNYASLKTAEANVKAVKSFEKKVTDVLAEADLNKRFSKLQSVAKAYNKLNAVQQNLASNFNEQVTDALDEYTNSFSELNDIISTLLDDVDNYPLPLEEVRKVIVEYNALSSGEKKLIENVQIIKQVTNDVKKVDSFIKKVNMNIEKNPSTIVKEFRKLTELQVKLLKGYEYLNAQGQSTNLLATIIELEKGNQIENDVALEFIKSIDGLTESGYYKNDLKDAVTKIRADYDSLTSAQKLLVKNYSKLTQAESDLQKVEEVRALYNVDLEAWQKAYNKLSRKLELLYDQIPTP